MLPVNLIFQIGVFLLLLAISILNSNVVATTTDLNVYVIGSPRVLIHTIYGDLYHLDYSIASDIDDTPLIELSLSGGLSFNRAHSIVSSVLKDNGVVVVDDGNFYRFLKDNEGVDYFHHTPMSGYTLKVLGYIGKDFLVVGHKDGIERVFSYSVLTRFGYTLEHLGSCDYALNYGGRVIAYPSCVPFKSITDSVTGNVTAQVNNNEGDSVLPNVFLRNGQ